MKVSMYSDVVIGYWVGSVKSLTTDVRIHARETRSRE